MKRKDLKDKIQCEEITCAKDCEGGRIYTVPKCDSCSKVKLVEPCFDDMCKVAPIVHIVKKIEDECIGRPTMQVADPTRNEKWCKCDSDLKKVIGKDACENGGEAGRKEACEFDAAKGVCGLKKGAAAPPAASAPTSAPASAAVSGSGSSSS